MNGRVYDAKLGRFASADPHIQAAGNTQSYNRYTYVLNNPLKYSDPSGFFFKKLFKNKIFKVVAAIALAAVTYGAVSSWALAQFGTAVSVTTVGAMGATATATAISLSAAAHVAIGALAGAVSGFVSGAFTTGTVDGGLSGAASGAIFGGIGGSSLAPHARVAAHGLTGGASSVANGGKFGPGFISAGFTKAVNGSSGFSVNVGDSWSRIAASATRAALIGGTASRIGGGKFANGAQTAALADIVNNSGDAIADKASRRRGPQINQRRPYPGHVQFVKEASGVFATVAFWNPAGWAAGIINVGVSAYDRIINQEWKGLAADATEQGATKVMGKLARQLVVEVAPKAAPPALRALVDVTSAVLSTPVKMMPKPEEN